MHLAPREEIENFVREYHALGLPFTKILNTLKENQDFDTEKYGLGFVLQSPKFVSVLTSLPDSQN